VEGNVEMAEVLWLDNGYAVEKDTLVKDCPVVMIGITNNISYV
jgi:hypothetical protein